MVYTLKQMSTLNVWLQIHGLKNTHNLLKAQIFLFFSEALSMCHIKSCVFFNPHIYVYIYIYIYIYIYSLPDGV